MNGIKGGYWLSKLVDQMPPGEINFANFTHLFYASVNVVLGPTPPENNYELNVTPTDKQWMPIFTTTNRAHGVKSFLSIGGRPDSEIPEPANPLTEIFSSMASTPEGRLSFILHSIQVARNYGFDGLDLDWEYPNTIDDMGNLALLFQEWRNEISSESTTSGLPKLLLSAAVYFKPSFLNAEIVYPIVAINNYVDLVGLRCYDYHTSRDTSVTAAHACLYDTNENNDKSTSVGIEAWINANLDPSKLLMGLPLYGRTWTLTDPDQHGIGAPAIENVMPYHDIRNFNAVQFRTPTYDEGTVSEYSYSGTFWVGYDGPASTVRKIQFARTKRLGGYFLWALQFDLGSELSAGASIAWGGANGI